MQYQSYEKKMSMMISNIESSNSFKATRSSLPIIGEISDLSFKEYHELISHDNVLVVDSSGFVLNLENISTDYVNSEEAVTGFSKMSRLYLEVKTITCDSLESLEFDESYLYFLYTAKKINGSYQLRLKTIDRSLIADAEKRYASVCNMREQFLPSSTIENVRKYVMSTDFENDRTNINIPVETLGMKYMESVNKDNPSYNIPTVFESTETLKDN